VTNFKVAAWYDHYGTQGQRRSCGGYVNPSRVSFPSLTMLSVYPTSSGLRTLEVWQTAASRWREGFRSLFRLYFSVFFVEMMKWWLHLKVKIRFFPPYPRFAGASRAGGGRVESCARWISRDPVGFRVRLCGFRTASDPRLSSLAMVVALVR
jgi:hypothetical protein